MPVITMNVPCTLKTRTGSDVYGQATYGAVKKTVCAVIKFEIKRQHSTVRADSSGTRGHADETVAQIKVLMPKTTVVELDDILTLRGFNSRVLSITERFDVMGRLDHFEVEATVE